MGNGVVIYADDYVNTGLWIFHCGYSRIVSRKPLPVPMVELERTGKFTIGNLYVLSGDEELAKEVITAITAKPGWYKGLRYRYSALGEESDLFGHGFDLLVWYQARQWALEVWQNIDSGGASRFDVTAEPYDPETYVDYPRELQAAARSCPTPQ
ncbi:hypothetical protein D9M68_894010 [compost metagenome]